jgi:hypothetical protein
VVYCCEIKQKYRKRRVLFTKGLLEFAKFFTRKVAARKVGMKVSHSFVDGWEELME